MARVDEEGSVIFVGEEFERGGVFERVNVVFLVEFEGQGTFEGVEILEDELDELGSRRVAEEESCAWIFDNLRAFILEISLGFGGFRFDLTEGIHWIE